MRELASERVGLNCSACLFMFEASCMHASAYAHAYIRILRTVPIGTPPPPRGKLLVVACLCAFMMPCSRARGDDTTSRFSEHFWYTNSSVGARGV